MQDTAIDPRDYSIHAAGPHRLQDWRPDTLNISAMIGAVVLMIGGATIAARLAELPAIGTLFQPQIIETSPQFSPDTADGAPLAVLDPLTASAGDIDIAPTPPVLKAHS